MIREYYFEFAYWDFHELIYEAPSGQSTDIHVSAFPDKDFAPE